MVMFDAKVAGPVTARLLASVVCLVTERVPLTDTLLEKVAEVAPRVL